MTTLSVKDLPSVSAQELLDAVTSNLTINLDNGRQYSIAELQQIPLITNSGGVSLNSMLNSFDRKLKKLSEEFNYVSGKPSEVPEKFVLRAKIVKTILAQRVVALKAHEDANKLAVLKGFKDSIILDKKAQTLKGLTLSEVEGLTDAELFAKFGDLVTTSHQYTQTA